MLLSKTPNVCPVCVQTRCELCSAVYAVAAFQRARIDLRSCALHSLAEFSGALDPGSKVCSAALCVVMTFSPRDLPHPPLDLPALSYPSVPYRLLVASFAQSACMLNSPCPLLGVNACFTRCASPAASTASR